MSTLPRRSIADLRARYTLEPSLRDVFVEGAFDRDALTQAVKSNGQSNRVVYEIATVDVPDSDLARHGLSCGNKQRVVVLARELSGLDASCPLRCIVDRDLDHWFGRIECTPRLIWTDYCSLELYFLSDETLRDIMLATAQCRISKWPEYIDSLTTALREAYIFRLADRELGWNMKWLPLERCLSLSAASGRLIFDHGEYSRRLLMANSRAKDSSVFGSTVGRWRAAVSGDVRLAIHGHDFVEVVSWSIGKFKGHKEFASPNAVTRLFVLLGDRLSELLRRLE